MGLEREKVERSQQNRHKRRGADDDPNGISHNQPATKCCPVIGIEPAPTSDGKPFPSDLESLPERRSSRQELIFCGPMDCVVMIGGGAM